uniref:Uncharacterized protein n=1 Tax=Romanomermis culicivorax TaxID=13658 RepID=A0A915IJJ9_ROMCU
MICSSFDETLKLAQEIRVFIPVALILEKVVHGQGRLSTKNGEKERNGDSTLAVSDKQSIDQLCFNERTNSMK